MISQETFFNLFDTHVRQLATVNGMTNADVERIIQIFAEAMKNPYMDERQIYQQLIETREETV